MKKNHILLLLWLLLLHNTYSCLAAAQLPEYGLHIQTYPDNSNNYTSMALEGGKPIETKGKDFKLDFKLCARESNIFGTIFRLITNDGKNIDLMYSVNKNNKRYPMLVTGNSVHSIPQEVKCGTWVDVSLTIRQDGTMTLTYDKTSINIKDENQKKIRSLKIAFGYCRFEGYTQADVASVSLKDIGVSRDGKAFRLWKMALHHDDNCYDELGHSVATGHNSLWIIDKYITWNRIYSKEYEATPSIAFNPETATFYMAMDKKKLYVYHAGNAAEDTITVKGGEYAANYPNQLIFLPERNQLLSYTLDDNLYTVFNPETQCWDSDQAPVHEHDYWNNTLNYNPENESLVSFGGYGHYHFNNELIISYPFRKNAPQQRITLKDITPRYTASSVINGHTMYIFGGRGCPSGKQELFPRDYYDLYAVNLQTKEVTKLWEASEIPMSKDFHAGENMIYDKENDCFYLFTSLQGGTLMRIDDKSPHFEPMSLPTNEKLDAQYYYTNLYYSPKYAKLYAIVLQSQVSGKTHINIYAMNYPPIPVKSLEQSGQDSGYEGLTVWGACILALIVTAGTVVAVFYLKKRKKSGSKPAVDTKRQENFAGVPSFHNYHLNRSCVCFFGGFRVMDKEGNDITPLFTPTLKALLILLILHTGKNANGINGHKILQILWYDKSDESAKNNRGVYVSKLRNLMEKVGEVSILNQNNSYSIQFGGDTLCDYLETLRLYKENNNGNIDKLLELLLQGMMLPNMEADWIDTFKNDFSDQTIDLLCQFLKQNDLPDTLKLKIADTLFQHDYINEEALSVKCRILYSQGKKGLAKTVYDSFCKEYSTSLGTAYPTSLMNVIEKAETQG